MFHKGNVVKRIKGHFCDMEIGDIGTVRTFKISSSGNPSVRLYEYDSETTPKWHDCRNLIVIRQSISPLEVLVLESINELNRYTPDTNQEKTE